MAQVKSTKEEWLSVVQAARYIGIRESRMYQMVNSGEIPSFIKPGNKNGRKVSTRALDEWMESICRPGLSENARRIREAVAR